MSYRYDDLNEYNWLMKEIVKHESDQAKALGKLLLETFSFDSVIDLGCATGLYLLPFKNAGKVVFGVDGAGEAGGDLGKDEFELFDLRNPYFPKRGFGLCLSIETAEHIPPQYAETYIESIARCAPLVFFSAAQPGQGGEGHYNEQDRPYWDSLFGKFGFVFDQGLTDAIMKTINVDSVYEHCMWLRNHSWIYRKS